MKILLIDTCGSTGSIALADTTAPQPSITHTRLPGRTASERLVPAIKQLVSRVGVSLESLAAVVVVHGPGSFTGIRVALSAAKGLCEALALPLVAISRLAVIANLAGSHAGEPVRALLDAGRGEFYSGLFVDGDCLRETLLTRGELLAGEPVRMVVCEPAVAQSLAAFAPHLIPEPGAADAVPLALARIQQQEFDDIATLDANYLRRTDAEIFAKPVAAQAAAQQPGTPAR